MIYGLDNPSRPPVGCDTRGRSGHSAHARAPLVREEPLPQPPRTIAGVDMSVRIDQVQAAVVVLALPTLEIIDQAVWRGAVEFPYVHASGASIQ